MRVVISVSPGRPVAGDDVVFSIELTNRGQGTAHDVTLDVVAPGEVAVQRVDVVAGQTTRLDALTRWHLPRLASGGQATLLLRGNVRPLVGEHLELCVMLLSEGAPLEHCAAFETQQGQELAADAPDAQGPPFPTAAPVRVLGFDSGSDNYLGWLLLLAGLCVLGVWVGLQVRGSRRSDIGEQ
jgi:hypothetical protein